jgi:adenine C2-methylase RlmN of 23S rRNA A2503 and tRNA A37
MNFLGTYQWKNRLVLVFAPSPEDEQYQEQLEHLGNEQEIFERDLILFHIFGEQGGFAGENRLSEKDSEELRQQFNIDKTSFAVVLIGKDGTEKRRWQEPVENSELFALIDAMPMRQQEMR